VNNWKLVELGLHLRSPTIDILKDYMANPIRYFGDASLRAIFFMMNTLRALNYENKQTRIDEFLDFLFCPLNDSACLHRYNIASNYW